MLHQSSLLSSNTAGSDWPDFSSCSSLHLKALMFVYVCEYKLVCGCHGRRRKHLASCLLCFPLAFYSSERKPVDLQVHFRLFCLLDGCLSSCLWIWGTLWRKSHSSCSHHSGQFSWINCDLLTRKCKQVDWSESGHENIYCCRWNVKNAAVLNM